MTNQIRRLLLIGLVGALIVSPWSGVVGATLAGETGNPTSPDGVTAQSSSELVGVDASDLPGDGTEVDPYQISNVSELQAMEDNLSAHYVLVSDINASATATANGGKGFDPIGGRFDPFIGSFDGQGHTVQDLVIDRPSQEIIGLFARNNGVIQDVKVIVSVTGSSPVGGLVGQNSRNGQIRNASASGSVNGSGIVGGLVGQNARFEGNSGTIQNVSTSASVNGSAFVGGLVGASDGAIRNASASGSVNGSGIVGGLVGTNDGVVRNVSASGPVNGSGRVGGLIGTNLNRGVVADAFATGNVAGSTDVGGLIGSNQGSVQDSYWDKSATGQSTSAGTATGLPTAEMQGQTARSNMGGLTFGTVWQARENDYPVLIAFLKRQSPPPASDPTPPPIDDDTSVPTDPDGDGVYEDVNGDGRFNIIDVVDFLDHYTDKTVQNNADQFNFNGEGGVSILDVSVLLDQVL